MMNMIGDRQRTVAIGRFVVPVIVGAGIVSAFQVGKVPVVMTALQDDLGVGLASASWLLSAFALVGALAAAPLGLLVGRFGAKGMALSGLLMQAVGSAIGGVSPVFDIILASRVLEGIGFLLLIVAAPTLITAATRDGGREKAMALWATFMPVGICLVMLAAPVLGLIGWRGLWLGNAVLLAGYAVLLRGYMRAIPDANLRDDFDRRAIGDDLGWALRSGAPWVLGGIFAAYTACYFAVFGFLPMLLSKGMQIGPELSGVLGAVIVLAGAAGNIVCGVMLARGYQAQRILMTAFAVMTVCSAGILIDGIAVLVPFPAALIFSFVGGFIPVVVFDAAGRSAPRSALVAVTIGFAMQGNNIGLMVGPAIAGSMAEQFGWGSIGILIAGIACVAVLLGRSLLGRMR
ncbi:MAG: MFS transporter [Thalassospira sp.]|uniref:MFS transporter n=1 Tax=Thalassospira sp. TaxID=1912094 RepID=UPI000C6731AE|nr:MFS transporter [Thalassospira sp.]MAZ33365.1 MFS transporter [Thalassospira sp.]